MDKAALYDFVKAYLSGALKVKGESDYARGYEKGLASLQEILERLETPDIFDSKTLKEIDKALVRNIG